MFYVGEVISHSAMCNEESTMLQQGMNSRQEQPYRIILMSLRQNAPYADRLEDDGRTLIYEGHNQRRGSNCRYPDQVDQPMRFSGGTLTENGKFFEAAKRHADRSAPPETVRVYEKIKDGIWTYNGVYLLTDAWQEISGGRKVFKFRLEVTDADIDTAGKPKVYLEHNRMIPSTVKREVWKRDGGKCVTCGATDNLHFDHILPYSKGETSLKVANIQLLCARHNLEKHDKIQ